MNNEPADDRHQAAQELCEYCQRVKNWDWTIANWDEEDFALKRSILASRSGLSQLCWRLPKFLDSGRMAYIEHHPSLACLSASAARGCKLCDLFKRRALARSVPREHLDQCLDKEAQEKFYLLRIWLQVAPGRWRLLWRQEGRHVIVFWISSCPRESPFG